MRKEGRELEGFTGVKGATVAGKGENATKSNRGVYCVFTKRKENAQVADLA